MSALAAAIAGVLALAVTKLGPQLVEGASAWLRAHGAPPPPGDSVDPQPPSPAV